MVKIKRNSRIDRHREEFLYKKKRSSETVIRDIEDVLTVVSDLKNKKKEFLVCFYLNSKNMLIKKETLSIDLMNKAFIHPKEIFYPATELNASSILLLHNHPSGNAIPSEKDNEMVKKIAQAGEIMGIVINYN